jgi:uncharacterized iron-regulated membrane protein
VAAVRSGQQGDVWLRRHRGRGSNEQDTIMDSSSTGNSGRRLAHLGAVAVAAVLVAIGAGAVVKGIDGRSTVRDALAAEHIVGTPDFTPAAIKTKAREAGLRGLALPSCSVAAKQIATGDDARCFAEYMRVDALTATHGATYAQMPRFATKDDKGTNDPAAALTYPNGEPMSNPARQVWVTETALSTALNTSYMAEQVSLFGIVVGAALLLVGLALAGFGLSGVRVPRPVKARATEARPAAAMSRM